MTAFVLIKSTSEEKYSQVIFNLLRVGQRIDKN